MNNTLPSHLSIQEINYYNLDSQYKNWISQLKYIDVEFAHFIEMLSSKKLEDTQLDSSVSKDLSAVRQENKSMLDKVINYGNQLESLRECEDVACDTFYLNDHQRFRNEIEQHIEKVRDFKSSFYKSLIGSLD